MSTAGELLMASDAAEKILNTLRAQSPSDGLTRRPPKNRPRMSAGNFDIDDLSTSTSI